VDFDPHYLRVEETMGLQPIGDRIIVRREAAEEKTAGGIVLPATAQNKPQRGTVIAVGPGKLKKDGTRVPPQLKVGDRVLFTSWAGDEFRNRQAKVEGEILVMHESDVMCVIA
jgi:chaperonin GroES